MHGIFQRARKVWSLPANPVADVEKPPLRASGDIQVFSPEEVWALVRAAGSEQDAALFLTAAFTGLRMGELLALRWRDVDFAGSAVRVRASYYAGHLTTPKSGKVRAVPLAPDVADALAQLGRRGDWVGDDDLVFAGVGGDTGWLGAAPPLQGRAGGGRPAPAAVPRPASHVRHADDRQGRHPPRAGVDGPRRHPDHDAIPALRAARRGRRARRRGVRGGAAAERSGTTWICRPKSRDVPRTSEHRPGDRFDWWSRRSIAARFRGNIAADTGDSSGPRTAWDDLAEHPVRRVYAVVVGVTGWGWRPSTRGPSRTSLRKRVGRSASQGRAVRRRRSRPKGRP